MGDPAEYSAQGGVTTFRGGPLRQNSAYGTVDVVEQELSIERGIMTSALDGKFKGFRFGTQPVIVKWYKNIRQMMNINDALKNTTGMKEVIYGADDGKIYFFDLDTAMYSRNPINVGYPIGSGLTVNPYGFPLLYAGQSDYKLSEYTGIVGMRIYNLINQKMIGFESGLNAAAASENGSGSCCHGVRTILGSPFSSRPSAPSTTYPTQSTSLMFMLAPLPMLICTASSGISFGSVVMTVITAAD